MMGLQFYETMSGSVDFGERDAPMSFTLRARSHGLRHFFRTRQFDAEGELDVPSFADHCYVAGTIGLKITGIAYKLRFQANDGKTYGFSGEKFVTPARFVQSMTFLQGRVASEDGCVSFPASLRFDVRSDLVEFLRSMKPVW